MGSQIDVLPHESECRTCATMLLDYIAIMEYLYKYSGVHCTPSTMYSEYNVLPNKRNFTSAFPFG